MVGVGIERFFRVDNRRVQSKVGVGRPARIGLAVLIDRGGRELPIQPDVAGLVVSTSAHDRVDVGVKELDGFDAVDLVQETS